MWPFGGRKIGDRLGAVQAGQPSAVELTASVVSPNTLTSPLTGMHSVLVLVELVERIGFSDERGRPAGDSATFDIYQPLGKVVLGGELIVLRDAEGEEITLVARRVRFSPMASHGGTPLGKVPPELVPLLRNATGRGVICYRELPLLEGDRVRLKAVVEPSTTVIADGYRSGTRTRYLARDDLAPVILEELLDAPAW